MSIELDLSPQVAVVTGSGSGIGEAIARLLAQAGAAVAIADLSVDSAARVADDINASGGKALAVQVDIADVASVDAAIKTVNAELGTISILVNNAATWVIKTFADTSPDEASKVIDVTLLGTMNMMRAALPDITANSGSIVSIISDGARIGERFMSVYSAAKAGLIGLTKSVAREVGPSGVRVNGVAPGTTATPGSARFIEAAGGPEKMAKAYPLGRIGQPEDIAGAVLFLVSPWSSWMTGQVLSVSGGFTMV
jgi:NAD(P)-dependent dehydrogenase (short-subunit alcohol dehydrogenase family)